MPLSDPYSSYLDRLARQRAEDELMRSRLGEASKQFQGGLGQWNDALRIQKADTRQAEQDTAKTAQTAFENEQTVEGLRLRKAQDARDAAQAQAREAREATEFTAKQAARPIEEARAAEDRAFTLRQRETSTADAARKAAIEKIKALPPETAMGDDVDVHGFIVQTGAAGGLTPDESLGLYRDAQQARTDARRTADLEARVKEAQIKKAERVGTPKVVHPSLDPAFKLEGKERDKFNALPIVKEYNAVKKSFDKMKSAAAQDSPAGDMTLIYSFMKMNDEGSTVRESEFEMARQAATMIDRAKTWVSTKTEGERLSPEQRKDFLMMAEAFMAANRSAYDEQASLFASRIKQGGGDPANVGIGVAAPSTVVDVPDDDNW